LLGRPFSIPKIKEHPLTTKAPAQKKQREYRKDKLPVYFAAKTGILPITSDGYEYYGADRRREKVQGLSLNFGDKGVTRPYDPSDELDAEIIAAVRKWIAQGRDERIRNFNVRELKPNTIQAPFPAWDDTNAKGIVEKFQGSGWNLADCILYEEQNRCRDDVLEALEALVEDDAAPDPLDIPSL
jgi:hypothetical protein